MAANINSRVVIDASAILSYIIPDESSPSNVLRTLKQYTNGEVTLLAPTLLNYEIGNAIKSAVKQKRLNHITAIDIIDGFKQIDIQYFDPNILDTITISIEHNLSFYDASYLSLAIEKNSKLLTLDKKLQDCLKTK